MSVVHFLFVCMCDDGMKFSSWIEAHCCVMWLSYGFIYSNDSITCVHNSDLEKRDSVFDLSKNQKKLPGFFLIRSKYSI